jgi:hypothetical protein
MAKRKPALHSWTGSEVPQAASIAPYEILKALATLEAIRSHAERAPNPNPDLVAQHGEREVVMSSLAMIRMMAAAAIERIADQTGYTVADADPMQQYSEAGQLQIQKEIQRQKRLLRERDKKALKAQTATDIA